jgi:hypothetical protein
MLVDTMIPETFEETHEFSGLITVSGFCWLLSYRNWKADYRLNPCKQGLEPSMFLYPSSMNT